MKEIPLNGITVYSEFWFTCNYERLWLTLRYSDSFLFILHLILSRQNTVFQIKTLINCDRTNMLTDLLHKSHSALVQYPTMLHFRTDMCMCAHHCCNKMYCGIFVWCIVGFVRWVYCCMGTEGLEEYQNDPLLTHWDRVTHLCVSKLTSIASDIGLSPGRRQAIIWNDAGIFLIGPLGTNFSEILIELQTFSLKKIRLKMSSAKCRPFCLGLNVLTHWPMANMAVILQI